MNMTWSLSQRKQESKSSPSSACDCFHTTESLIVGNHHELHCGRIKASESAQQGNTSTDRWMNIFFYLLRLITSQNANVKNTTELQHSKYHQKVCQGFIHLILNPNFMQE